MLYYENLFMHITDDYFFFEPITLKPANECMAIDRKLNESFLVSKAAIGFMTNSQTQTKNIFENISNSSLEYQFKTLGSSSEALLWVIGDPGVAGYKEFRKKFSQFF